MAANVMEFTDANWKSEVLESSTPVLVDFWAPWCGPCRMLAPTIEKLAGEFQGRVKVGKMDTDQNMDRVESYRDSVPGRQRNRALGGRSARGALQRRDFEGRGRVTN
jgi:thioredoxin-like negative regulator of GroEL